MLTWLSKRPVVTRLLIAAYAIAVIASHETIQHLVIWCYDRYSRDAVNRAVRICGVAGIIFFVAFTVIQLRSSKRRVIKLAYLGLSFALMAAALPLLFYTDIEVVHFPQYAILAVLIYALTGRFGLSMFYTTLIGVVDECVQYYVMHPRWLINLDFNDMIYNIIGAGLGCAVVFLADGDRAHDRQTLAGKRSLLRRFAPLGLTAVIIGLCAVLSATGQLSPDPLPDGSKPPLVVRRRGAPTNFWEHTGWGKQYHELTPMEAGVIAMMLFAVYGALDCCQGRQEPDEVGC